MTERIIAAIENPLVDCIGHLTGRLLLKREPYDLVVEPIFEAAAANGTMIEINAQPAPPRPERAPRPDGGRRPAC